MQVVAAIIIYQGKILCVQRDKHEYAYLSDKFEFPGGKVEAGETNEEALIREIKEELAMDISIDSLFCTIEHQYPDFFIELNALFAA
ncbi:(deoxy)nucleoside triphosphate pyrophosphohydrolase [Pedobacter antarcticus]|uniref:(deoxy)nucleoside triphosphate pyrophosphohydrolase n=1 Tax=Pedobacter antarcticus TaxID=34086 RepID=UPI00292E0E16|nr:NUDIX domain-containing protein [Pedobacter antarcticus]